MQSEALRDLVAARYQPISAIEAQRVLGGRELGVSRLRLLPKGSGMRPIVNLGAPSTARFKRRMGRGDGGGGAAPAAAAAAAPARGGGGGGGVRKRRQRPGQQQELNMSFKPINWVLQPAFQVSSRAL